MRLVLRYLNVRRGMFCFTNGSGYLESGLVDELTSVVPFTDLWQIISRTVTLLTKPYCKCYKYVRPFVYCCLHASSCRIPEKERYQQHKISYQSKQCRPHHLYEGTHVLLSNIIRTLRQEHISGKEIVFQRSYDQSINFVASSWLVVLQWVGSTVQPSLTVRVSIFCHQRSWISFWDGTDTYAQILRTKYHVVPDTRVNNHTQAWFGTISRLELTFQSHHLHFTPYEWDNSCD